jgi:hypothetical protein
VAADERHWPAWSSNPQFDIVPHRASLAESGFVPLAPPTRREASISGKGYNEKRKKSREILDSKEIFGFNLIFSFL